MNLWGAIVLRDLRLAYQGGGAMLPLVFFLLVATLFPLAALLPVDRLIAPDAESGVLDQYAVRGLSDEGIATAKIAAHWLGFGPPLMIAAFPAAALLKLDGDVLTRLELGLAIGTPALAALGVMTSALTLGLRGAGALAGLVMLPLAVPLLIFGAGALGADGMGALKLLAATALVLIAMAPFAAGAAMRAGRD